MIACVFALPTYCTVPTVLYLLYCNYCTSLALYIHSIPTIQQVVQASEASEKRYLQDQGSTTNPSRHNHAYIGRQAPNPVHLSEANIRFPPRNTQTRKQARGPKFPPARSRSASYSLSFHSVLSISISTSQLTAHPLCSPQPQPQPQPEPVSQSMYLHSLPPILKSQHPTTSPTLTYPPTHLQYSTYIHTFTSTYLPT